MSAAAFEPLAPVLPAAPARSPVSFRGFPSSLEASALRTLIDRAARGYPGEWTATWTSSGVELRASGMQARIILAGPPGAVTVSLRAALGGQAVPEAARSLAVRCRDEAERFARAQTAPAEPAPLPAPARLHPVQEAGEGVRAPAIAQLITAALATVPGPSWRVDWSHPTRSQAVITAFVDGQEIGGLMVEYGRPWGPWGPSAGTSVPEDVRAAFRAVRDALAQRRGVAA